MSTVAAATDQRPAAGAPSAEAPSTGTGRVSGARGRWRDHIVTCVVAFIIAIYGVALVQGSQLVTDLIPEDSGTAGLIVFITALVFLALGAFSAAVVTVNSFSTIVAGRVRQIAQYRLLGATAGSLRGKLAIEGVIAGVIGTITGLIAGTIAYAILIGQLVAAGNLPDLEYTMFSWRPLVPAVMVIATIAIAAWVGTRPVGRVSPVQALSQSVEAPLDLSRTPIVQRVLAIILVGGGALLLIGGAALGAGTPLGLPIAFVGGAASFTGFVVGARMFVPALLTAVGRVMGGGVAARLAASNAVRSPRAATRGTIGMIVGVTLTVMFVVAIAITRAVTLDYAASLNDGNSAAYVEVTNGMLDVLTWITVALVGVSAIIGATGMVANLSLGVLQRQRELGLLRAVGATGAQVRASIGLEAVITSIVAIGAGAVLGIAYGWVGAQATLGSLTISAGGFGIVPLLVPGWLIAIIAGSAVLLAAVTALAPAIRATRVAPIE
ncbi:MAG: FtsX-like permease family protein, partial [Pseudoclavibacter sp.]